MGDLGSIPGLGRSPREGNGYPLQYSWASLLAQLIKNPACNVGDLGSIPGLGRSPGEGNGYSLQYSGLENSIDSIVYGVAKESDATKTTTVSIGKIQRLLTGFQQCRVPCRRLVSNY